MRVPRVMTYLACLIIVVTLSQVAWLLPADGNTPKGDSSILKVTANQPPILTIPRQTFTPLPRADPDFPDEWYRNQSAVNVVMWYVLAVCLTTSILKGITGRDGGTPWGWADGDIISTPNYAGFTITKGNMKMI
jgi:hypothetical protein